MSNSKRSAKGFTPRPLVRINSSMAGSGERTAITQEQSLNDLTEKVLNKKGHTAPDATKSAATETPDPIEETVEQEVPVTESAPTVALSKEQIDIIAKAASEKAVAEAREQLEKTFAEEKAALQAELEAAKQSAEQASEAATKAAQEKEVLAGVFNTLGYTEPVQPSEAKQKEMVASANVNLYTAPSSDKPFGAVKDALDILDASPAAVKTTTGGSQYIYADQTLLDRFVKENKAAVLRDLEAWGKKNGLLRGGGGVQSYAQTKASTTIGDIPGGFLDVLASVMRTENRSRLVMWQFPTTVHQFDRGAGTQAQIPRSPYIPAPVSSAQRTLSGGGVYRQIDSGNQNVQTGVELATLMEYGLGASSDAPPITVPTFVDSYSLIDLMSILQRNLLRDYFSFEDVAIREQYKKTNAIIYNNSGAVTATPTVGSLTLTFLNNLFAYMQEQRIPTYSNGMYVYVGPSSVIASFKNSLSTSWEAPSPQELMALTNILNPTTIGTGEVDKVTGFVGSYGNFMLFDTNSYGVGSPTPGGINGVQTETIGSAVTTKSGFAFGADAVGRAVGTEFSIVQDEKTDFGRSNRFIWRSEEAFHALDVAPQAGDSRPIPQQLRVLETRFV